MAASAGLLMLFRWAWALALSAVLLLVVYNFGSSQASIKELPWCRASESGVLSLPGAPEVRERCGSATRQLCRHSLADSIIVRNQRAILHHAVAAMIRSMGRHGTGEGVPQHKLRFRLLEELAGVWLAQM